MNQVVSMLTPATVDGARHQIQSTYDRAGAIYALTLDGASYVSAAVYDARGQPTMTVYGNGLMTRHAYDPVTFRLARTRTEHYGVAGPDYNPVGAAVEDRVYGYDLAGNVLQIQDWTPGSGVAANPGAASVTNPALAARLAAGDALIRAYSYDPLYRLASATGRECATVPGPRPVTDDPRCGYNSGGFGSLNQDNAPAMTTLYTERYSYDPIGDLVTLSHSTSAATWTRDFGFGGLPAADWQAAWTAHLNAGVWASPPATQLTHLGNTPTVSTPTYSFDACGNLTGITTSRHLGWTHRGTLGRYRDQAGPAAPTMTATYLYNSAGQRTMKLVVRGQITESTVYIDGMYEYFSQTSPGGDVQNNTLHLTLATGRVATLRVGTALAGDVTPPQKYVVGDHLGTSLVVLDGTGTWVNREEFSPYGETLLGSYAFKRYRYAGRERDEESGLDYSQARYYACWLARWMSPDLLTVMSLGANLNPYVYVSGRPVTSSDPSGLDDKIYDYSKESPGGAPPAAAPQDTPTASADTQQKTADNTSADDADNTCEPDLTPIASFQQYDKNGKPVVPLDGAALMEQFNNVLQHTQTPQYQVESAKFLRDRQVQAEYDRHAAIGRKLDEQPESAYPLIGELTAADAWIRNGYYTEGAVHVVLAAADLDGLESLAKGGVKTALKSLARETREAMLSSVVKSSAQTTFVYRLVDQTGEAAYYGISKDYRLLTRLDEHATQFGMNFHAMQVISEPLYEQEAKMLETWLIQRDKPLLNWMESSIRPPVQGLYLPQETKPIVSALNPAMYGPR